MWIGFKLEVTITSFSLDAGDSAERLWVRGEGGHSKTRPFESISRVHMSSQRLNQQAEDLHGSTLSLLHIYYSFSLCIFMGLWTMRMNGSLTLVSGLSIFYLLLGCHAQLQFEVFTSSHYILFCHIWLLSLRILFFSNKIQKGNGYERGGGRIWEK